MSSSDPRVPMVHCRVCLKNIKDRASYFGWHAQQQPHKDAISAMGLVADPGPVPARYYCFTCNKLVDTGTSVETLDAHVKTSGHIVCLRTAAILEAERNRKFVVNHSVV